jgi:TetR/AcrR family transcriptional repressor of nem operon
MAGFIVSSLQGATLLAKAQRSPEPERRFRDLLFSAILAPETQVPEFIETL